MFTKIPAEVFFHQHHQFLELPQSPETPHTFTTTPRSHSATSSSNANNRPRTKFRPAQPTSKNVNGKQLPLFTALSTTTPATSTITTTTATSHLNSSKSHYHRTHPHPHGHPYPHHRHHHYYNHHIRHHHNSPDTVSRRQQQQDQKLKKLLRQKEQKVGLEQQPIAGGESQRKVETSPKMITKLINATATYISNTTIRPIITTLSATSPKTATAPITPTTKRMLSNSSILAEATPTSATKKRVTCKGRRRKTDKTQLIKHLQQHQQQHREHERQQKLLVEQNLLKQHVYPPPTTQTLNLDLNIEAINRKLDEEERREMDNLRNNSSINQEEVQSMVMQRWITKAQNGTEAETKTKAVEIIEENLASNLSRSRVSKSGKKVYMTGEAEILKKDSKLAMKRVEALTEGGRLSKTPLLTRTFSTIETKATLTEPNIFHGINNNNTEVSLAGSSQTTSIYVKDEDGSGDNNTGATTMLTSTSNTVDGKDNSPTSTSKAYAAEGSTYLSPHPETTPTAITIIKNIKSTKSTKPTKLLNSKNSLRFKDLLPMIHQVAYHSNNSNMYVMTTTPLNEKNDNSIINQEGNTATLNPIQRLLAPTTLTSLSTSSSALSLLHSSSLKPDWSAPVLTPEEEETLSLTTNSYQQNLLSTIEKIIDNSNQVKNILFPAEINDMIATTLSTNTAGSDQQTSTETVDKKVLDHLTTTIATTTTISTRMPLKVTTASSRKSMRRTSQRLIATPFHRLTYVPKGVGNTDIDNIDNIENVDNDNDNDSISTTTTRVAMLFAENKTGNQNRNDTNKQLWLWPLQNAQNRSRNDNRVSDYKQDQVDPNQERGKEEAKDYNNTFTDLSNSRLTVISGYLPTLASAILPESLRLAKIKINRERKKMLHMRNITNFT